MNRKKRFAAGIISAVLTMTTIAFPSPKEKTGTVSAADTPEPAASFSAEDITPAVSEDETASLPERFDLREKGLVSSVKNQGSFGTCWTFAASGALETSLIKNEPFIDLSEMHLAYFSFYGDNTPVSPERDPDKFISGGHISYAAASYARWFGPVTEALLPYDTAEADIDPSLQSRNDYFVTDIGILNPYTIKDTDAEYMIRFSDEEIKQMLREENAVAVNIRFEDTYKEETFAQYDPTNGKTNHGVLIVGWDDSFPKEKFLVTPPGDGAWIVKNSWGEKWGDNGFFYVSYYDGSISDACCLKAEKAGRYQTNYQHDELFCTAAITPDKKYLNQGYMANVFTAEKDEYISGAGFYTTDNGTSYKINVYTGLKDLNDPVSGTPNTAQTGTEKYAGYHTVAIDDPVLVRKGDTFSVVARLENPGTSCPLPVEAAVVLMENRFPNNVSEISEEEIEEGSSAGESFISTNGTRWTDTKGMEIEEVYNNPKMPGTNVKYYVGNVCLKAFGSSDLTEPEVSEKKRSVLSSLTINKKPLTVADKNGEPVTELEMQITSLNDAVDILPTGTGTITINGNEAVSGHPFSELISYGCENIIKIVSTEEGLEPTEYTLKLIKNSAVPDYITETIVFDQSYASVFGEDGYQFKDGESISDHLGETLTVIEPDREYNLELAARRDLSAVLSEKNLYVEGEMITGLFDFTGKMYYSSTYAMNDAMDIHTRATSLLGENAFKVYPDYDTDLYFQIAASEEAPQSTVWHISIPKRPSFTSHDIRITIPTNSWINITMDYREGTKAQYRLVPKYKTETPDKNDLYPYEIIKNDETVSIEDLIPGQTYSLYMKIMSDGTNFASEIMERIIGMPGGSSICSFNCQKERIIFNERHYTAVAPDGKELKSYDIISDYTGKDIVITGEDGESISVMVPERREAPEIRINYATGIFEGYYVIHDKKLKYLVNCNYAWEGNPNSIDIFADEEAEKITLEKILASSYRPGDKISFFYEATDSEFASESTDFVIPEQRTVSKDMLKVADYNAYMISLEEHEGLEYGISSDFKFPFTWSDKPVFDTLLPGKRYLLAVRYRATENEPYSKCIYTTVTTLPPLYDLGDINGDEQLNAIDIMLLRRILLMDVEADPYQRRGADYNADGMINIIDLQRLNQAIAG